MHRKDNARETKPTETEKWMRYAFTNGNGTDDCRRSTFSSFSTRSAWFSRRRPALSATRGVRLLLLTAVNYVLGVLGTYSARNGV